jgi:hypothetical protein
MKAQDGREEPREMDGFYIVVEKDGESGWRACLVKKETNKLLPGFYFIRN